MPRYLVEGTLRIRASPEAAAGGSAVLHRDEAIRPDACEGVTWIHAFVTPDRRRSFCIVDAPSPEAVRMASQATSGPIDRITEVQAFDPSFF
jgi:hypothetical protein